MFRLKNLTRQIQEAIQPTNVNELIAKIHNEFDTVTNVSEYRERLKKNISKGERLLALGFKNSVSAVEASKILSIKEEYNLLEYYSFNYPNYKFITKENVVMICKKYGLIKGPVSRYISDVPEKNVLEMEAFKLREEDGIKHANFYYLPGRGNVKRSIAENYFEGAEYGHFDYSLPTFSGSGDTIEGFIKVEDKSIKFHFVKPQFEICASVKDFDIRGMYVSDKNELVNIPDPIVLQPVNGGYLIISKWGLESNDGGLVNEKMN